MNRDIISMQSLSSTFLSAEKDIEIILKKLFIENRQYSQELIRLLVINTKDCLDNKTNQEYQDIVNEMSLPALRDRGYIRLEPKIMLGEHEDVKSYIIITINDFRPNATNTEFRDCTVTFEVICHTDQWDIGNYRVRPLKICGYIDGILNKNRLSGIGRFLFRGCHEIVLDEHLSGYTLSFDAIHGSDDEIPKQ